jgi:hypothetical protein
MSLWEIGKMREGWIKANSPPTKDKAEITEAEFASLMAKEIDESEEEISADEFFESIKARQ